MPNKSRWIHCVECGRNRLHVGHGLCKQCHQRQWEEASSYKRLQEQSRQCNGHSKKCGKLRDTNIYILYAPEVNRYKIGQSDYPERRAKEVAAGSPVDIELLWWGLCPGGTEGMLRARFRDQRVRGEWFQSLTDEQIAFIKEQAKEA